MPSSDSIKRGRELVDQFLSVFGDTPASELFNDSKKIVPPEPIDRNAKRADRTVSLKNAIDLLSQSDYLDKECVKGFVEYFKSLYSPNSEGEEFRHMYSDVCDTMYSYFSDRHWSKGWVPAKIVYLESNMKEIVKEFRIRYPKTDALKSTVKLQDHISLETIRIRNQGRRNADYFSRIKELGDNVREAQEQLKDSLSETEKKLEAMREEINSTRREYIAILGILAAVVLAFNGGMTFSATSIGSVYGYHPFRIALVVFVVGFTLFNLLFALFTFLLKIARGRLDEKPSSTESRPSFWYVKLWGEGGWALFLVPNAVFLIGIGVIFFFVANAYFVAA